MKLMNKANKQYLVLEFRSKSIRYAVGCSFDSNPSISLVGTWEYPEELDRENLLKTGEWLKQSLIKSGIKVRDVKIIVSMDELFWTRVDLPAGDEQESRQMMELRLERELPVAPDLLSVDWIEAPGEINGNQVFNVIAMKKNMINRYAQLIQGAGLKLSGLEPSIVSSHRALRKYYSSLEEGMVLSFNENKVEQISLHQGRINSFRNYQTLSETGYESAEAALITQILQGIKVHDVQSAVMESSPLFIIGPEDRLSYLKQSFFQGEKPVVRLLNEQKSSSLITINGIENPSEWMVFLGNLIYEIPESPACNLLKPRLFGRKSSHVSEISRKSGYKIVFGVLLLVLVLGLYAQKVIKYNRVKDEYNQFRSFLSVADKASLDATVMSRFKEQQVSILTLTAILSELWGEDYYLKVLTYDRSKDIALVGASANSQSVAELLNKLNASGIFTDAKLTYIRASSRNPDYPVEFGISLKWKPGFQKITPVIRKNTGNGGRS